MIDTARYPHLAALHAGLAATLFTFLATAISELATRNGEEYLAPFETLLARLRHAHPAPEWPHWAVTATVAFTRDLLKEESQFATSGHYRHSPDQFQLVADRVYADSTMMTGRYLTGLLLSYYLWPHHQQLLEFMTANFTRPDPRVTSFMEWGVGHGLLAASGRQAWPRASACLVDISPHSLEYTRRLWPEIAATEFQLDLLQPDLPTLPRVERLIASELLEHLPDPARLLQLARDHLLPQGQAYLTAAINSPQIDHLHQFRHADEVRALVTQSGFVIQTELVVTPPNRAHQATPPQVIALVVNPE